MNEQKNPTVRQIENASYGSDKMFVDVPGTVLRKLRVANERVAALRYRFILQNCRVFIGSRHKLNFND